MVALLIFASSDKKKLILARSEMMRRFLMNDEGFSILVRLFKAMIVLKVWIP